LTRFLERHGAAWDGLCQGKTIPRRGMIARRCPASKAGAERLTKSLAQEVASRRIGVNGVAASAIPLAVSARPLFRTRRPRLMPCHGHDDPP
jgi:hypothetical protein